jgi:N-acetyl-gamma-glutamylphosphate reductase
VAFFCVSKNAIKEYNPSIHNFNVAIVDCSYRFGYYHQAAYQKYKEESIIHVVSG